MQAVLLQTGVLCNIGRPAAKEVVSRIAPTLRDTAHTFTLQQATNVLSTIALLSFCDVKLIAAVVDKALPEIPSAPAPTIAALCYALGISGYSDHRLMRVRAPVHPLVPQRRLSTPFCIVLCLLPVLRFTYARRMCMFLDIWLIVLSTFATFYHYCFDCEELQWIVYGRQENSDSHPAQGCQERKRYVARQRVGCAGAGGGIGGASRGL